MTAATTGDLFAVLYAAHNVGDYWLQTDRQAREKGLPGWRGRKACAAHTASLTAVKAAAVAALHVTGRRVAWQRAGAALAADAVSHYIIDRRKPLEVLAGALEAPMGKLSFYRLGAPRPGRDDNPCMGTGAALLDQAWHIGWLGVWALVAGATSENLPGAA